MNPAPLHEHELEVDRVLRQHHARALANVSPRTQAQLHARRAATHAGPHARAIAWPLAAACALGVLALGLRWHPPSVEPAPVAIPGGMAETGAFEDPAATLDESPDLYLWLASADATTLALE